MIMIASAFVFLAVVLILMYIDHRRDAKTKHAHR